MLQSARGRLATSGAGVHPSWAFGLATSAGTVSPFAFILRSLTRPSGLERRYSPVGPTTRWTRAAGALLSASVLRRRVLRFAPPRQLNRSTAFYLHKPYQPWQSKRFRNSFLSPPSVCSSLFSVSYCLSLPHHYSPLGRLARAALFLPSAGALSLLRS